MNLKNLTNSDLLAYATILENIVTTNIGIQREMSEAVSGQFCTKEEVEKIYNKSQDVHQEADEVYEKIQKELDLRSKRDLGMKFGIRRSQAIIKELETFAQKKSVEHAEKENNLQTEAAKISEETLTNLEVVKDDNPE